MRLLINGLLQLRLQDGGFSRCEVGANTSWSNVASVTSQIVSAVLSHCCVNLVSSQSIKTWKESNVTAARIVWTVPTVSLDTVLAFLDIVYQYLYTFFCSCYFFKFVYVCVSQLRSSFKQVIIDFTYVLTLRKGFTNTLLHFVWLVTNLRLRSSHQLFSSRRFFSHKIFFRIPRSTVVWNHIFLNLISDFGFLCFIFNGMIRQRSFCFS